MEVSLDAVAPSNRQEAKQKVISLVFLRGIKGGRNREELDQHLSERSAQVQKETHESLGGNQLQKKLRKTLRGCKIHTKRITKNVENE